MVFEEGQILFEAEDGKTHYTWQPAHVELEPTASTVTIRGYPDDRLSLPERLTYTIPLSELPDGPSTIAVPVAEFPDGRPMITIPVREITSCEIVERGDISRNLLEGSGSAGSGLGDLLVLLLYMYLWIIDVIVAKTTKVSVIKLTQSGSGDSGQGWVIHLRSMRTGPKGQVATLEMGQRLAAFLREAGYEGAVSEELSVLKDSEALAREANRLTGLEASLRRKWVAAGGLAIILAWAAAVCFGSSAGSYMMEDGSPFWLAENLRWIVGSMATGSRYGFYCTLPALALGLLCLGIAGMVSILGRQNRSSFIAAIILGMVFALLGGCLTAWFGVLEWYY